MVVHAYSPSKVEGRSQGLLASKVPMALCSIWKQDNSAMTLQDDT